MSALYQGLLVLHYQPIARLSDWKVVGFESLTRCPAIGFESHSPGPHLAEHPNRAIQDDFFKFTFENALNDCTKMRALGIADFVTVNVNPQLLSQSLANWVLEHSAARGQPLEGIVFEITEQDASISHAQQCAVKSLRGRGARFAMDDYGKGASTDFRLSCLEFDFIKLDRSFLESAGSKSKESVLKAKITGFHQDGVNTIMECIETREQLALAERVGCRFVQGRAVSWPMTLENARTWISDGSCAGAV